LRRYFQLTILFGIIALFCSSGCRRSPPTDPQYYEKERERIQKPQEQEKAESYLPDRYPWETEKANGGLRTVAQRIEAFQMKIDEEIKAIDRFFNPPKK